MNKLDFINFYAERNQTTKKAATEIVENMLDTIADALVQKEEIAFIGFGKFGIKKREGGIGRNPKTGEAIQIKPSKTVVFKAGKLLKDFVNE